MGDALLSKLEAGAFMFKLSDANPLTKGLRRVQKEEVDINGWRRRFIYISGDIMLTGPNQMKTEHTFKISEFVSVERLTLAEATSLKCPLSPHHAFRITLTKKREQVWVCENELEFDQWMSGLSYVIRHGNSRNAPRASNVPFTNDSLDGTDEDLFKAVQVSSQTFIASSRKIEEHFSDASLSFQRKEKEIRRSLQDLEDAERGILFVSVQEKLNSLNAENRKILIAISSKLSSQEGDVRENIKRDAVCSLSELSNAFAKERGLASQKEMSRRAAENQRNFEAAVNAVCESEEERRHVLRSSWTKSFEHLLSKQFAAIEDAKRCEEQRRSAESQRFMALFSDLTTSEADTRAAICEDWCSGDGDIHTQCIRHAAATSEKNMVDTHIDERRNCEEEEGKLRCVVEESHQIHHTDVVLDFMKRLRVLQDEESSRRRFSCENRASALHSEINCTENSEWDLIAQLFFTEAAKVKQRAFDRQREEFFKEANTVNALEKTGRGVILSENESLWLILCTKFFADGHTIERKRFLHQVREIERKERVQRDSFIRQQSAIWQQDILAVKKGILSTRSFGISLSHMQRFADAIDKYMSTRLGDSLASAAVFLRDGLLVQQSGMTDGVAAGPMARLFSLCSQLEAGGTCNICLETSRRRHLTVCTLDGTDCLIGTVSK